MVSSWATCSPHFNFETQVLHGMFGGQGCIQSTALRTVDRLVHSRPPVLSRPPCAQSTALCTVDRLVLSRPPCAQSTALCTVDRLVHSRPLCASDCALRWRATELFFGESTSTLGSATHHCARHLHHNTATISTNGSYQNCEECCTLRWFRADVVDCVSLNRYLAASNIRICKRCSVPLIKESGCDKMKCRCGCVSSPAPNPVSFKLSLAALALVTTFGLSLSTARSSCYSLPCCFLRSLRHTVQDRCERTMRHRFSCRSNVVNLNNVAAKNAPPPPGLTMCRSSGWSTSDTTPTIA
jgi:hypothetical protein